MKRIALLLCLALVSLPVDAGGPDGVNTLKVDLEAVVEHGAVEPVDGVTTAGQPDEAGFQVFAEAGYAAVIDLRTAGENRGLDEPAVVKALGMDYISLPIGRGGITRVNARALKGLIDAYDEPVLVHCGSANRVGALFALSAFEETGDVESSMAAGREAGLTRLENTVREVLGADSPIAIAIHGGAGTMNRADLDAEKERAIRATLAHALQAGHARLSDGDSALDAVEAAILVLEDSPLFNAGHGAVFNSQGGHELDAAIMDGRTRNAGAITGVQRIRNPILLARRVMTDSPHVMLAGAGAEEFAVSQAFNLVEEDYFSTEFRRQQLERARSKQTSLNELPPPEFRFGTVGAVALDKDGNIAAGTSTGGMTNKRYGRIGDVPVIGAGTYADNDTCAVSATGHGEYFIRSVVAHDIASLVRYTDASLQDAVDNVVHGKLVEMEGTGGVISINRDGDIVMEHNTPGMYRGSIDTSGKLSTAIYKDE